MMRMVNGWKNKGDRMASMQSLKRRIKSARNIKQITKAMEMVAASKMRRAQSQALATRPYARKLESTLQAITGLTESSQHPLLATNETGVDIIVLFSTDKPLAGSLNANLFRGTADFLKDKTDKPHFVIVGQKARQFVLGNDYVIDADFSGVSDPVSFQAAVPIAHYLIDGYITGKFKSISLCYMDFISTIVQRFRSIPLLPFTNTWTTLAENASEVVSLQSGAQYIFEPNAESILEWLLPYYTEMIIYQTLLETRASEHSSRMVAMKNASDSATDIINELTLSYNKQRQAKITNELLDNTTAALVVA
jgi:F-type H+-transporting ATPase subunit gamma